MRTTVNLCRDAKELKNQSSEAKMHTFPALGHPVTMDGIDVLSDAKIDHVVNYMRMGMRDRVAAKKRRAMVTSVHWWDDKILVTGKYEKDEFVARVMEHIADQYDGPVGSDPPTWNFQEWGPVATSTRPMPQISEDYRWEARPATMKTAYRTRRSKTRTRKRPIPQCGRLY